MDEKMCICEFVSIFFKYLILIISYRVTEDLGKNYFSVVKEYDLLN